jgi:cellulose synthase/poly-beta-1,6-N-acetylglucosamine synthase-like glycosyltransferase
LELVLYLFGALVRLPWLPLQAFPALGTTLTRYHSLFRYVRLWVNLASNWTYTPMQPVDDPTITSKDMTVIIPTVAENLQQLKETVQSAYRLEPLEILLVTPDSRVKRVYQMVEELGSPKIIQVLSVSQANKRRQLCRAIPEVETKITLLLDDDVWLPEKFTKWILAPFEDARVGGVGTNQQIRRFNRSNIWEFLGAIYLVRRNFDCTACNWIDGGLPCLSGRAVAYRSEILQDPNFTYGFTHETWGSDHFLNADDDNFITRWLFSHNWKIQMQNHRECEVETTLEDDSKYLRQCLRWVRSNWRSNLTSLTEGYMWMVSGASFQYLHRFRGVGRPPSQPLFGLGRFALPLLILAP